MALHANNIFASYQTKGYESVDWFYCSAVCLMTKTIKSGMVVRLSDIKHAGQVEVRLEACITVDE